LNFSYRLHGLVLIPNIISESFKVTLQGLIKPLDLNMPQSLALSCHELINHQKLVKEKSTTIKKFEGLWRMDVYDGICEIIKWKPLDDGNSCCNDLVLSFLEINPLQKSHPVREKLHRILSHRFSCKWSHHSRNLAHSVIHNWVRLSVSSNFHSGLLINHFYLTCQYTCTTVSPSVSLIGKAS
jgi:hypothetical protein